MSFVAFSLDEIAGHVSDAPALNAYIEERAAIRTLTLGGTKCFAIYQEEMPQFCLRLGINERSIQLQETDFNEIRMAQFTRAGGRKKTASASSSPDTRRAAHSSDVDGNREKYVNFRTLHAGKRELERLERDLATLKRKIADAEEKLIQSVREGAVKEQEVLAFREKASSSPEHLGLEFDKLLEHPDIQNVDVRSNTLVVTTGPIRIEYLRSVYHIGCFEIRLSPTGEVMFQNKDRCRNGYHHPHINNDGLPCLGNIKMAIPRAIAEHKYSVAVALCIEFLKSYEDSEGYRPYYRIGNWA